MSGFITARTCFNKIKRELCSSLMLLQFPMKEILCLPNHYCFSQLVIQSVKFEKKGEQSIIFINIAALTTVLKMMLQS